MIKTFWQHLTKKRRTQLVLLLILMLLASIMEVVSIGAVVPFLGALTSRNTTKAPPRKNHPRKHPVRPLAFTEMVLLLLLLQVVISEAVQQVLLLVFWDEVLELVRCVCVCLQAPCPFGRSLRRGLLRAFGNRSRCPLQALPRHLGSHSVDHFHALHIYNCLVHDLEGQLHLRNGLGVGHCLGYGAVGDLRLDPDNADL